MQFNTGTLSKVALITCLAASLAACASKKPVDDTAPALPAPAPAPAYEPAPAPTGPVSSAPLPGSVPDFVINAGDRVYFDTDMYTIRDDARPVLDSQASWLTRYPQVAVRIEGNADERGTREYNFALAARRASAVRDYLVSRGVAAGRIETVSYGKERPIDPGSTEEAWAKNRNGHTAITGGAR